MITPTRRQIDNKFPVLGFTVHTGELPFFEVLITTDRKWFSPANEAGRNASNFYSSRQDGGLTRATGADSYYMIPAPVLRGFAQAEPKPTELYYTLIAYRGADGSGPVFTQGPQALPSSAPSVSIAPNFTGQTLSAVLGISTDRLRRVSEGSAALGWGAAAGAAAGNNGRGALVDADGDMGEGEDGYSVARGLSDAGDYTDAGDYSGDGDYSGAQEHSHAHGGQTQEPQDGYEFNNTQGGGRAAQQSYDDAYGDEGEAFGHGDAGDDIDYSDGFEEHGPAQSQQASALESTFPAGVNEPEALYGEEADGYDKASLAHHDDEDQYDFASELSVEDEPKTARAYSSDDYAYSAQSAGAYHPNGNGNGHVHHAGQLAAHGLDAPDFNYEQQFDVGGAEEGVYQPGGKGNYGQAESYGQGAAFYGDEGDVDYQALDAPAAAVAPQPLTIEAKRRTIERVARFESGSAGYKAINADGEYEGRFGTDHPAYHRYHVGLSYGNVQFTQDGGGLGRLLAMMRERDARAFSDIFGADADELVRVTNAPGPASKDVPGGRSARVQPVGGADLWAQPWRARFERAGDHPPFQAAQNELASLAYLDPMLKFAKWLGLDTDRALTLVIDRAIQMGVGGARRWIIGAVGPVQTSALRQQALAALGKPDLRTFQSSVPGLQADGQWGAMSHAALVSALRALGATSPIPVPSREQMLDALVRRAAGQRWAQRVEELRRATDFTDTVYQF
jgi:hypothetical protein